MMDAIKKHQIQLDEEPPNMTDQQGHSDSTLRDETREDLQQL